MIPTTPTKGFMDWWKQIDMPFVYSVNENWSIGRNRAINWAINNGYTKILFWRNELRMSPRNFLELLETIENTDHFVRPFGFICVGEPKVGSIATYLPLGAGAIAGPISLFREIKGYDQILSNNLSEK